MKKLLVTGFEPFGGEDVNPSWEAVSRLPCEIRGARVIKLLVPVAFGASITTVLDAMMYEAPDAVICIGQAGGRAAITPERIAININDARMPDNTGYQPVDQTIYADGESAYFATIPVKKMVAAMLGAGVPAKLSDSAGTFVCNHLMYGVLHHQKLSFPAMPGGFIHVPLLPAQAAAHPGAPCLALEDIIKGLTAALGAVVSHFMESK